MRKATRDAVAGIVLALVAGATAYFVGDGYPERMSSPRPIHLVAVEDKLAVPAPPPRRAVLIVADGLRRDAALGMRAVARLAAAGQCLTTDVGPISISRPVWSTLSTGVEADRTGVRANAFTAPLAVDSIWAVARRAGRQVVARSDSTWWKELFPASFDRHEIIDYADPHFALDGLGDVDLIHAGWIDEAGHDFGGTSAEYAAGVRRLDDELDAFLARLDLASDVVIFTADHGHTDRGGHGGRTPEVAMVLTCFAGRGVAHAGAARTIPSLVIAPALAVLDGLPFPRNMRARGDDLDAIWHIVDATAFSASYLDDRRAAVARFRAANPAWPEGYQAGRHDQALRLSLLAGLCIAVACAAVRRRRRAPLQALGVLLYLAATVAAAVALHLLVRGPLDLSAVNKRPDYVRMALIACSLAAATLFLLRLAVARDLTRATADLAVLVGIGLVANLGLVWVFGAPLGFPLPGPLFLFLPIFAAALTVALAGLLALASLALLAQRIYSTP